MKSKIILTEKVSNKQRAFGSVNDYYPAKILLPDGREKVALFTENQIEVAINRASKNKEDVEQTQKKSLWSLLLGG